MEHNHPSSAYTCTHCACHNPIWDTIDNHVFNPELLEKLTQGLERFTQTDGETLVITGGIIRPLIDGATDTIEAIGIHKGKVVAVGTYDDVVKTMDDNHYKYTLKKLKKHQALLPGLIEPHVHIIPTALTWGWLDLGRFQGQDLMQDYDKKYLKDTIQEYAETHKVRLLAGEWILGRAVDPAFMPFTVNEPPALNKLVDIDYTFLDEVEPKHPVFLQSASMHTVYVNSPAMEIIFKKSDAVRKQYGSLEEYKKQTNGQLQEEEGMKPAMDALPLLQKIEMFIQSFKHITALFTEANSRGVTFMYDAGMMDIFKIILDLYIPFHQRRVRTGAAALCSTVDEIKKLPNYQPVTEYKDAYYGNVKLVSDGSNQGLTGYQSVPYCCYPANNLGIFNFAYEVDEQNDAPPKASYTELVHMAIVEKGWPLMIHANGDQAVKYALEVYGNAIPESDAQPDSVNDKRHRIEHCSILTPEQIQTMKHLGISPSFLIGHVGYWGYAFNKAIFLQKSEKLDLCKSSLDAGLRISLHSDNSVSPLGPLRMMEQSITRIMEATPGVTEEDVLNASERLTAEEALRAVTTDAAWQCHADNWVGSLKVGNFADFVVLDQDPLSLDEVYMVMRNIPVLETWVGGAMVYKLPVLQTA